MTNRVPNEIVLAVENGDTAVVRRWLADGGDPNWLLGEDVNKYPEYKLLLLAVNRHPNSLDTVRALLAHGADVNHVFTWPIEGGHSLTALSEATMGSTGTNFDIARFLLRNGADISPIIKEALLRPYLLRVLLAGGADVSARCCHDETPETWARRQSASGSCTWTWNRQLYAESLAILEGARLAGSYRNYVLQDFKELLRLRSLLARNRARINDQAPEVVARLFGGRTAGRSRPPTRHRPASDSLQGVPDPAFWLVMEYWRLGDWRRPETVFL